MLGVPSEDQQLPPNVKTLLHGFEDQIFGDFVVCPHTPDGKGELRMVFVKSASHLVDRKDPTE